MSLGWLFDLEWLKVLNLSGDKLLLAEILVRDYLEDAMLCRAEEGIAHLSVSD